MSSISNYKTLIAAADTFRAAAVEQLKVWGDRSNVDVISNQSKNADPAAVVFDAINSAKKRNVDLLLVDTAGRLQTKNNLMDELAKIKKIIDKKVPDAIVESLLVLDASQGQNGLKQAKSFAKSADLSGAIITKLDLKEVKKSEGVISVVTSLDIPGRNDVGAVYDGDPIFTKKVEYFGQPLFAVAATTTELARKAVLKAKITYKTLKPVVDVREALKKNYLF